MIVERRKFFLFLAGLVIFAAGLACGMGSTPEGAAPQTTAPVDVGEPAEPVYEEPAAEEPPAEEPPDEEPSPVSTLLPTTGGEQPQPAIPESRRLTLEFPPVMRTGDSMRIRMQLEVDNLGNITPTAMVEGNVVSGEVVVIPNLYETHNVVAEARLDMAGMEVQPSGTVSESLTQGKAVTFYWSVRPNEAGSYQGTAWLHLRFVPKGGGEESRVPVSVQFLEIEARSFLGLLSGGAARGVGMVGSVVGSVLGFPFVDDFAKFLWRRLRGSLKS